MSQTVQTKPRIIAITHAVQISLDESFFTEAWLEEFSSYMYPMFDIEDVYNDLGRLYLSGVVDSGTTFIEGYGEVAKFKLKFEQNSETQSHFEVGPPDDMRPL